MQRCYQQRRRNLQINLAVPPKPHVNLRNIRAQIHPKPLAHDANKPQLHTVNHVRRSRKPNKRARRLADRQSRSSGAHGALILLT